MKQAAAVMIAVLLMFNHAAADAQEAHATARNDSVSIRFIDVDMRTALQAIARYLDRPLIFAGLTDIRITLETPVAVPRGMLPSLLRGVLESHEYDLVVDSAFYRVERKAPPVPVSAAQEGPVELRVIRLRHAAAADVAATVNALYGRASALGEIGVMPPTLTEQLRQQRSPTGGIERPAGVTPSASLSGEVIIVPDPGTNSLLIRASPADFALIEAAVQEVDVRPLQVLIEVLIAEVRRDRSFAFGLAFGLDTTRIRGTNVNVTGSNTGLGLGDFVLNVMNVGGVDLNATMRAAAARGEVYIRSRPVLVAANNEIAHILVGSQRPFVQVSRSLPTDVPSRDQVIQYRDVGTQLTVLPTISSDGYVMLSVTQEVNAATSETAFDAPVISTRSVQTRLLVKDGQTVVLGGLTDEQRDRSRSGVPILSSIPLLGGLFGSSAQRTVGTELFLFLTPRIIRTDEDVEDATKPLLERADRIKG